MTAPAPPVDAVGPSFPSSRPAASTVGSAAAGSVGLALPQSPFDPPPQRSGAAVRGGAVAIAGQCAKTALRLVGTVVLARLLTPEDFGLVAMVTVITGFVGMFTDVGLSAATVQRPRVTHEQVSTLFWLNVALGCGLAALTAASASLIAWFYEEPRLTWMTVTLAGTFVIAGLTVQHQALLQRRMRFVTVTWIGIAAQFVATAVALATSWQGWGPWSLIAMSVTAPLVTMFLCWTAAGWLPGVPVRHSGVRELLKFGGWLTGFGFVNYWVRNGDNLLIGRALGAGPLGLYSRAYSLLMLPITQVCAPISSVAVSALSRSIDDPVTFRADFRRLYRMVMTLALPLIVVSLVSADDIVLLLLGPNWTGAAPLFRTLGLVAIFQPIGNAAGWLFTASGRVRALFYWGIISASVTVPAFVIGLPWGALGVAVAYSAAVWCTVGLLLTMATRGTAVRVSDFLSTIGPELVSAGLAVAAAAWTATVAPGPAAARVAATVAVTAVVYGAALGIFGRWSKIGLSTLFTRPVAATSRR